MNCWSSGPRENLISIVLNKYYRIYVNLMKISRSLCIAMRINMKIICCDSEWGTIPRGTSSKTSTIVGSVSMNMLFITMDSRKNVSNWFSDVKKQQVQCVKNLWILSNSQRKIISVNKYSNSISLVIILCYCLSVWISWLRNGIKLLNSALGKSNKISNPWNWLIVLQLIGLFIPSFV